VRLRGGELTPRGLYDMVLAATGDEGLAQDAMSKRISQQLRRGENIDL
jgi:hypothetical protein